MTRVAAAILAAGESRRLGRPKQLLPFRGTTLVRAIAGEACASACLHVGVIVGANAFSIAAALDGMPLAVVPNVLWTEGMASSIRCAVDWTRRAGCDALVLLVCDQPRLSAAHVDRLVTEHLSTRVPVASRYADTLGVPAVFGSDAFAELHTLTGDTGARGLLARPDVRAIDWPDGAEDVDTPAMARDVLGIPA